jgi:alkylation response protein AidB-like acyl-CoA dehydrogenase
MDYQFGAEEVELRGRLRALIAEAFPDGFPGIFVADPEPLQRSADFCRSLGELGLLTMAWPREYGGQDASLWSQIVFGEEMWGHNEPRGGQYMGVNWIGPALMQFGTDEQKRTHLPPIARGEIQWCQGFSEPESGSDLASLRLRATSTKEGFRLRGQKIWTSYADLASWCFVAARTSSDGPKQHGITVFLVPMGRPGIEVRPIPTVLGPHHFNEVFFDDVLVTEDEILGGLDKGWDVITAGLVFERIGAARYARSDRLLHQAYARLADKWHDQPTTARSAWARAVVNARVARLYAYRSAVDRDGANPVGGAVRYSASISRLMSTTLDQQGADALLDLLGTDALRDHSEPGAPSNGDVEHQLRYSQAATVAAGTLEIQKTLIARGAL